MLGPADQPKRRWWPSAGAGGSPCCSALVGVLVLLWRPARLADLFDLPGWLDVPQRPGPAAT